MHKVLSSLGLAQKAGKLVCGTDIVIDKMTEGKVSLIFVANDASASTIDKIEKKAFYYNVPIIKSFTSIELNNAVGKENVKMIGVLDSGFANSMIKNCESGKEN